MRAKKIGYFLSVLLLFSGFVCSVGALPDTTVTFRGNGVTIDLTFPDEAHPLDNIPHDLTITANTDIILQNFTVSIKAPVNSGWQEIRKREEIGQNLSKNTPWTVPLSMSLPQDVNGTLSCFIYVLTNQTAEPLVYSLFTTHVSKLTFSDMQSLYDEMLANYTMLQANYTTLLNDYDDLLANYNSSLANYTALLSQYNQLSANYNAQVSTYQTLLANYNKLSDDYDALNVNYRSKINEYSALQTDYESLNSTRNSLQANYTNLQADYDELNQRYADLLTDLNNLQTDLNDSVGEVNTNRIVMFIFVITLVALVAFIIYLKRGKEEPYVVIRKETVSMNQDENT